MDGKDPFQFKTMTWDEYPDRIPFFKSKFEFFAEPISPAHLKQVGVLLPDDARRLSALARSVGLFALAGDDGRFRSVDHLHLAYLQDAAGEDPVRSWLYERDIPFQRRVFAVPVSEPDVSLVTTWKMVVRYWVAFERMGGVGTLVFDHTL